MTGKEARSSSMSSLSVFAITFLICWVLLKIIGTLMYTYELAQFHSIDWSLNEHGIAFNGSPTFGPQTSTSEIKSVVPDTGGGPVSEWCPNTTSMNGYLVMGWAGDIGVCCNMADDFAGSIPFYDEGRFRHYFCGKWPHTDHIYQPIP